MAPAEGAGGVLAACWRRNMIRASTVIALVALVGLVGGVAYYGWHVTHPPKPVYCMLQGDTIGMTSKEAAGYEAWWNAQPTHCYTGDTPSWPGLNP